MSYKEHVLAQERALPQCQRICLSAHLEQPWAEKLISAGFDTGQPSAWILEGLLYYLQAQVAQQVMETVSRLAAAGSWLGLDLVNQATLTSSRTQTYQDQRLRAGIPWLFAVDEPHRWLLELGWQATVSTLGEVAVRYGRWPSPSPPPNHSSSSERPHAFFIAAQRVENV